MKNKLTTIILMVNSAVFLMMMPMVILAEEPPPIEPSIPGKVEGNGAYFEITDSEYLNISLQSSEKITVILESIPKTISLHINASTSTNSTTLTIGGLEPNKTYYKFEDSYKNEAVFVSDENGSYVWTQDLAQSHHIWFQPEDNGTIFLPGECSNYGTWDPVTSTCTLNRDLTESVEITANNITLNCGSHSITGADIGYGIYLRKKTDVTIKNCIISNFWSPILLNESSNNTLSSNMVFNNSYLGIYLTYSSNNNALNNNAASSNGTYGIYLYNSSYNVLYNNSTSNNSYGIALDNSSNNNTLSSNTVLNNYTGILANKFSNNNTIIDNTADSNRNAGIFFNYYSDNNTLINNTVTVNKNYGIYFVYSNSNKTYRNNFVDNPFQAYLHVSFNNSFDDGYPSGGNYWSDYVGVDLYSGPNQDEPGADGIGDTPYIFPRGQDRYPFMKKDGWKAPPVLDVPKFYQFNLRWATSTYDYTSSNIRTFGCALTSAVMILNYHGATTTPDTNEPITPKTLNKWLIDRKGYSENGNLLWLKLNPYAEPDKYLTKVKLATSTDTSPASANYQNVINTLNNELKNGRPVAVKVMYYNASTTATTTHYIVATGKLDNTWAINDPGYSDKETLADNKYPNYRNEIYGIRTFSAASTSTKIGLGISGGSPIELFLVDPLNRGLGFDSTIDDTVYEIPTGSYFEETIDSDSEIPGTIPSIKMLYIAEPVFGDYQLKVTGKAADTYQLSFDFYDSEGKATSTIIRGITSESTVNTYAVTYSSIIKEPITPVHIVTLTDIKNEIEISRTLNLIDNDGIMNSLIQKLDAAEKKTNQKSFKAAKNILNAAENEIIAQKSKHITEEVADILLKDVEYIIQSISVKISIKPFSIMAGLSFINRFVTEGLFNGLNKLITLFRNLIERISSLFTNRQEIKTSSLAPKTTEETAETHYKDWNVYYNRYYGFQIKYPKDWIIEEFGGGRAVDFRSTSSPQAPSGYPSDWRWPGNITISEDWSGPNFKQPFRDFVEYIARGHDGFQKFESFQEIVTYKGLRGYRITYWAEQIVTMRQYLINPVTLFEYPKYNFDDTQPRAIEIWLHSSDFIDIYDKMIKTFEFK